MKKYEQDMTKGNLWKQIFVFSLPLMLSNVLQVIFNLADVAVVGRFAGSAALGSVGSTTTLVTLFTGALIGLSGGTNVVVALRAGEKNRNNMESTVHTAAVITLIAGLLVSVLGIVLAERLLMLMNTKAELLEQAVLYFRIYFLGMPALAMYNYGNAVLSAIGDTKRPLYFLSGAGVINVVLNLFFVIVCNLGVAGVALASIISLYISAVLIMVTLFKSKEKYGLSWKKLCIRPDVANQLLRIGIPSAMQYVIFQFANVFVQVGVNSFNAVTVTGTAAAANADALVYDVMAAFYTACASFIGQNYGAKNKNRIVKTYLICLLYSFGTGLVMGMGILWNGRTFLALFTADAAVVEAGMLRLSVMGVSYAISAFMDCAIAAARGLGKTVVPTIVVIMGSCVFRLVWIYTVFAFFQTIISLYLLYAFSWGITALFEIIYFVAIYRKNVSGLSKQALIP